MCLSLRNKFILGKRRVCCVVFFFLFPLDTSTIISETSLGWNPWRCLWVCGLVIRGWSSALLCKAVPLPLIHFWQHCIPPCATSRPVTKLCWAPFPHPQAWQTGHSSPGLSLIWQNFWVSSAPWGCWSSAKHTGCPPRGVEEISYRLLESNLSNSYREVFDYIGKISVR